MNRTLKRVLVGIGAALGVAAVGLGGYVMVQARAFDASMDKVYDLPPPSVTASTDPAVVARGKHLAETLGGCSVSDCHGADLGGGKTIKFGPIGTITGPNISSGGLGSLYSDGELARLIRHGVKKDGRSVRFMPAGDFSWLPAPDVLAIVSYVRSMPAVDRPNGVIQLGVLGKVLDRKDLLPLDVARRIDHEHDDKPPAPTPTADYGRFVGRLCTGCHGPTLSGGPIPGAPPDMPKPLNLTPDATGLAGWTYDDFVQVMKTATRKNGKKLDPMMSTELIMKMDETERRALWEYLHTVPAVAYGNR